MATTTTTTTRRSAALPPLLYVLAAFAVISGAYGAVTAVNTVATFGRSRDAYDRIVQSGTDGLKNLVGDGELVYLQREAEVRYARRNAALPLAGVGLILSCLMFAGAMRAMRGDRWGVSAWSFAATASIPYQLLGLTLTILINRDLTSVVAALPPLQRLVVDNAQRVSIGMCGFAILYYGVCVIYLRSPSMRRVFSDGAARTPPSA